MNGAHAEVMTGEARPRGIKRTQDDALALDDDQRFAKRFHLLNLSECRTDNQNLLYSKELAADAYNSMQTKMAHSASPYQVNRNPHHLLSSQLELKRNYAKTTTCSSTILKIEFTSTI